MRRPGSSLVKLLAVVFLAGCPECAPGQVGPGVARLTVRNVGAIATMINADTPCGFAATTVLQSPTMTGMVGGMGTLTYSITDCAIDAGDSKEISKSCTDVTTTVQGKITVTAKRT